MVALEGGCYGSLPHRGISSPEPQPSLPNSQEFPKSEVAMLSAFALWWKSNLSAKKFSWGHNKGTEIQSLMTIGMQLAWLEQKLETTDMN